MSQSLASFSGNLNIAYPKSHKLWKNFKNYRMFLDNSKKTEDWNPKQGLKRIKKKWKENKKNSDFYNNCSKTRESRCIPALSNQKSNRNFAVCTFNLGFTVFTETSSRSATSRYFNPSTQSQYKNLPAFFRQTVHKKPGVSSAGSPIPRIKLLSFVNFRVLRLKFPVHTDFRTLLCSK